MNCGFPLTHGRSSVIVIGALMTAGCQATARIQTPPPAENYISQPTPLRPAETPVESLSQETSTPAPAPASPLAPTAVFDPDGLKTGPGSGFVVLDDPRVIPGAQATWLSADELVLGVVVGGAARAYPISQMAYHHIANDVIDGQPFLVTY